MKRALPKPKPHKTCCNPDCKKPAKPGFRFCEGCLGWAYHKMHKDGYLIEKKTYDS